MKKLSDFLPKDDFLSGVEYSQRIQQVQTKGEAQAKAEAQERAEKQKAQSRWEELIEWRTDKDGCSILGSAEKSPQNIITFLENYPLFKNKLHLNEYTHEWEFNDEKYANYPIEDIIKNRIWSELGIKFDTNVKSAVREFMFDHLYNPVKEYLLSLEWDGVKRLETLFIDNLYAEDNKLNRVMTRNQFIATVKRIFEPGCKWESMLILVGKTGCGKTAILQALGYALGQKFAKKNTLCYIDNLSLPITKDGVITANTASMVIYDELSKFLGVKAEVGKAFLSACVDKQRLPYDTHNTDLPRHYTLWGTTNERDILKDKSVEFERRFWIIDCQREMNYEVYPKFKSMELCDQIWAEAYHYYKENPNENLMIPQEVIQEFRNAQEEFKAHDSAEDWAKEILDTKYHLPYVGGFEDYTDFSKQVNGEGFYDLNESQLSHINEIKGSWLTQILFDKFKITRCATYLSKLLKDEWEYKRIKRDGTTQWYFLRKPKPYSEDAEER